MGNKQHRGDATKINLLQQLDDIGDDQFDQFINEDSVREFCEARGREVPTDRYTAKELIDDLSEEDQRELMALYEN